MPEGEFEEPTTTVKDLIALPTCTHHWIIETPNGPISKGVCKLCGEEREFSNQYRPNNTMVSGWSHHKEQNEADDQNNKTP